MAHYDTFRAQLAIAHPAFGHALWEPEPGDHFPPVEVGDVGFIRQGKFHRLFNALLPGDHPSHSTFRVPEGHEQLQPSIANHIDHGTLSRNNFCSYGVRVSPGESEIFASGPPVAGSADVSFSCKRKHGAVLSLPVAARREDTFAQAHFRSWITRHIDSWFTFTQGHGLGIEMEDIVLVTGCHRTRSWSNIAFYEGQADARVSFGVQVTGVYGTTVNWQASSQHVQGAVLSHGPSGENLPENQCIFIRGFRVKRSFKIFPRVKGAAEPAPDPSGNNDEGEIEVVSITSVPEYRDPLHVLLEYIAERTPHCDLVLVHDDDLERILRVDDRTSMETLQPAEVMSYLQMLKPEVAVAVMSDHLPSNDEGSRTNKKSEMVAMLSEKLKGLDDVTSSVPLLSHASVSTKNREESVQYDTCHPAEVIPRHDIAELAEPSRITQLVSSLYIPISEYFNMGDVVGSIHEIDARITRYERLLSISPRIDPSRLILVLCMAMSQLERHMLSNQRQDLDKSIACFTESILLQPRSEQGPWIPRAFFLLSRALIMRSKLSKQPEDAISATEYLRHLRGQPYEAFVFPLHQVTTLLVDALAVQVELEAGNMMQNVEEMAVLCRELLTFNVSSVDTSRLIALIDWAVLSKFRPGFPDQPLDQVIECLRAARMHRPDLREARLALALSLSCRYCVAFVNADYEEAASVLDEIVTSSSPGNTQDELVAKSQEFGAMLATFRMTAHQTPEYSEEAIYRVRAFLDSPSVQEPFHSAVVSGPEEVAKQRFRYFDSIEGLDASSENPPLLQPEPMVSFGGYEDDLSEFGRKMELLGGLLPGIHNDDITEIDEAIEKGQIILASSAPRDLPASCLFELFGSILFEAFQRTKKIEYLNESIRTRRQVLENPLPQFLRSTTLRQLSLSLLTRSLFLPDHRGQDLDEGTELLAQFVNDQHEAFPDRFRFAQLWAAIARRNQHPTVSAAYKSVVSLTRDTLHFAPTLRLQHATLPTSDNTPSMPLDYASYQVDRHQLEDAIVALERGRVSIWSAMGHHRSLGDQLLHGDPVLGQKFAVINRDLEDLIKSFPLSYRLSMGDDTSDILRAVDPFGRLVLRRRRLLKERDNFISPIQTFPGVDGAVTSPSFDTLRSVTSSGPIIIINHSEWRSDILILVHNTSPSLIPTPVDFYDRASTLKDKLLDSRRKYGLNSNHYDETLASVLRELYKLVGKPVINRLRQLQVPEQSHVWWCPTSVFCSLPLHALGPIPSDDGETHYFLDLYICSYTVTLSALIQSRNRDFGSRSPNPPSLLLVAQPEPSLPTVTGEIKDIQALNIDVTSLISEAATPAAVINGFHHHRCVHFACHGTLEASKPFEAGFELYGDQRLTLLEIVRLHLPTAEFAFLSACHTADLTQGSTVDEGLHIAAAVQYCGFKSVVGTMWAMADVDGEDLAKYFYKSMFRQSRKGERVPYYERSAEALRHAVKKLRRKRGITLERWVNFVHYGA